MRAALSRNARYFYVFAATNPLDKKPHFAYDYSDVNLVILRTE
jgi:hypothetical protein